MPVSITTSNGLTWLRFGDGERGNALTPSVRKALLQTLEELSADSSLRAVVLEGTGKHFCAGADLHSHYQALKTDPSSVTGGTRREFSPIISMLSELPVPTIASLRGAVAGAGLGLALACDLRIADTTTRFSTAFTAIGLGPDSGVSHFLPRLVGLPLATDLMLRPRQVEAEEAKQISLVHEVVADSQQRARKVGSELAAGATFAYAAVKATLRAGQGNLSTALQVEADWQEHAAQTNDHRSAVEAFVNKSTPTFTGK